MSLKYLLVGLIFMITFSLHAEAIHPCPVFSNTDTTTFKKDPIFFYTTDYNFGKIHYGQRATCKITMKNLTSDSITITNVKASCGCTEPKWYPGPYTYGQVFAITLGFTGYTIGSFVKLVTVYFSNGFSKQVILRGETFDPAGTPLDSMPSINKQEEKK